MPPACPTIDRSPPRAIRPSSAAPSRTASRTITTTSRPAPSTSAATQCATTIICSARVDGVDGIKTGYIRASGFNIVTSVRRGSRHIVAVVFGGRTADARDARVRSLIDNNINYRLGQAHRAAGRRGLGDRTSAKGRRTGRPGKGQPHAVRAGARRVICSHRPRSRRPARPSRSSRTRSRRSSSSRHRAHGPLSPFPSCQPQLMPVAGRRQAASTSQRSRPSGASRRRGAACCAGAAAIARAPADPAPAVRRPQSRATAGRLRLPETVIAAAGDRRAKQNRAAAGSSRSAPSTTKTEAKQRLAPRRARRQGPAGARPIRSPRRSQRATRRFIAPVSPGSTKIRRKPPASTFKRSEIPCMLLKN